MRFRSVAATAVSVALAVCIFGCSTTVTTAPSNAPPAGCSPNGSLACDIGDGWTCAPGDIPQNEQPGLSCSAPQSDGADPTDDDYCCIAWTSDSTCTPDDDLTVPCAYPSLGYRCASGDDPDTLDSSLTCSPATLDADGTDDDYCCH